MPAKRISAVNRVHVSLLVIFVRPASKSCQAVYSLLYLSKGAVVLTRVKTREYYNLEDITSQRIKSLMLTLLGFNVPPP